MSFFIERQLYYKDVRTVISVLLRFALISEADIVLRNYHKNC